MDRKASEKDFGRWEGKVAVLDILIVALLIERSFEMFTSILGTWIPFLLIFGSTYLTGSYGKG